MGNVEVVVYFIVLKREQGISNRTSEN